MHTQEMPMSSAVSTTDQSVSKAQFFNELFGKFLQESNGYIETRELIPNEKTPIRRFHKTINEIVQHDPVGNYFFGVCPRTIESGKEKDIETIVTLWADLDINPDEAIKKLADFPLEPSIIIGSGRGLHSYWLLRTPEKIKPNTKGVLKGLAIMLDADRACHDLSRMLRVPNTKNLKYQPPRDAQIIKFEPEIRYNLSEFDAYAEEMPKKSEVPVHSPRAQQAVDLEGLGLSENIKNLIQEGKRDGDAFKSRSEADFKVVCALLNRGCSDAAIQAIFDKYPIGEKYKEHGIAYLERTIKSVKQKAVQQEPKTTTEDIHDQSTQLNSTKAVNSFLSRHKIIFSGHNFYEYRDGCYKKVNIEMVKRWLMDLIGNSLSKHEAEEMIYFLQAAVFVDVKDLNNTEYLNVKNGLLDVNRRILLPHSPKVYSTIQLDVNYDPSAKCEKWIATLKEIFPFSGEEEKIGDLQEFFGLCFTKTVKYTKALLCVGEGANGKSLILSVLTKLLGDGNITAVPLEKFDNTHYLVNLFGKLANISIETNAKSEVYDSMFKAVVSGDLIQADQKFKPSFQFNPFCKLIFATNNLPRVDDKTDSYFRRLIIVRFNKQFTEEEQNKNLNDELLQESEGILIWCLEGLKRLNARGRFELRAYLKQEINEYRVENNNVLSFVEEECELTPCASVSIGVLFNNYRKWCEDSEIGRAHV